MEESVYPKSTTRVTEEASKHPSSLSAMMVTLMFTWGEEYALLL